VGLVALAVLEDHCEAAPAPASYPGSSCGPLDRELVEVDHLAGQASAVVEVTRISMVVRFQVGLGLNGSYYHHDSVPVVQMAAGTVMG
jgi:hypothetical protein